MCMWRLHVHVEATCACGGCMCMWSMWRLHVHVEATCACGGYMCMWRLHVHVEAACAELKITAVPWIISST